VIDAAALENLHVKFYMFKTHMRLANLALFELSGEGYTNIIRVTAIHMSKFYIRFVNIGPNSLNVYALMEFLGGSNDYNQGICREAKAFYYV